MIRLLVTQDGLQVKLTKYNEINKETIFCLDSSNQIVQFFTYGCKIVINQNDLESIISTANIIDIYEKAYLFYSFRYQISYVHNMMQTVPLLDEYLTKYRDYKLLVPRHHYTELYKDIFSLVGITDDNIILLDDKHIYNIHHFAERSHWHENALEVTDVAIRTFERIRNTLSITPNINPTRKIYIKRDGVPNSLFSNSETGIIRKILNEDELIEKLQSCGFEIVTLGDKYFHDKKKILENAKIVIAPLGANCLNLVFTNLPRYIIFLSNSSPLGDHMIKKLLSIFNNKPVSYKHLLYPNDPRHSDPLNQWNSAYTVNVQQVMDNIADIL